MCLPADGTGSLVFTDDVTADRSSKSEVYPSILTAHIQPSAMKRTVQMDTMVISILLYNLLN